MSDLRTPTRITMIGHSTVLFEMGGLRILTDPFFGLHGNPVYRRLRPPSVGREELASVDMVLLSHDHWDHFDRRFFRMLPATVPVLVPRSAREWMRLRGVRRPIGIRRWDSLRQGGVTVWGVPARHLAVARGFVLEHNRVRTYFAGDTFHARFHERIARDLAPAVALLPVTTFRLPMTMGEDQAVRAVRDLQPQVVIPIHLGLEPRSPLLRRSQSVERFAEKLHRIAPAVKVVHLREGESWQPEAIETVPEGGSAVRREPSTDRLPAAPDGRARLRKLAPIVVRTIAAGRAPDPQRAAAALPRQGERPDRGNGGDRTSIEESIFGASAERDEHPDRVFLPWKRGSVPRVK